MFIMFSIWLNLQRLSCCLLILVSGAADAAITFKCMCKVVTLTWIKLETVRFKFPFFRIVRRSKRISVRRSKRISARRRSDGREKRAPSNEPLRQRQSTKTDKIVSLSRGIIILSYYYIIIVLFDCWLCDALIVWEAIKQLERKRRKRHASAKLLLARSTWLLLCYDALTTIEEIAAVAASAKEWR